MSLRRATVTGSAGHIGSHVAAALLEAGWSVRGLDLVPHRPEGGGRFEAVTGDVRDARAVAEACRGADVVFHAAMRYWTGAEPAAEIEGVALDGLRAVAAALRGTGARLVYTSSTAAVGEGRRGEVLDESHWNERAATPYTRAKVAAERLLRAEHGDLDAVSVLPAMTVGPGDRHGTASNARLLAMFRGARLPFWFDGGLNVVDVRDVAAAHLLAAERGARGARYIAAGHNVTYRDLVGAIRGVLGLAGRPSVRVPDAPVLLAARALEALAGLVGRPPVVTAAQVRARQGACAYYSAERSRRELGLHARPLDQTLRDLARWFVASGRLPPSTLDRLREP